MSHRFNNMNFSRSVSQEKLELIVNLCKIGRTKLELEHIVGIQRRTTTTYLRYLMDTKQVHIGKWTTTETNNYPVPVYMAGPGEDAPKPPRRTVHEIRAQAWAKLKSDPQRYRAYLQSRRKRPPIHVDFNPTPAVFNWQGQPSIFTKERSQK